MIYSYNNAHLNSFKRLSQSIKIYRFVNFFLVYGDLLSLFVHEDVLTDGSQSLQWFEPFFSFNEWHSPFIRHVLSCKKKYIVNT